MNDWRVPRQAVKDGEVVFFPRLTAANVWSIFANDRRHGLQIAVRRVVHRECRGHVAWRIDEDAH